MSVQPTLVPKPSTRRGPASSNDSNDMIAASLRDLQAIADQANVNEVAIKNVHKLLFHEFMNSRNMTARYAEDVRNQSYLKAVLGQDIFNFVSFRTFRPPEAYISFDGLVEARRARVEPMYGVVILPYNFVVNRLYAVDPETGDTILPTNLDTVVTGINDSMALSIDEGDIKKAFNGHNRDYWVRRVAFPLEQDVDYVGADVLITLPDTLVDRCNLVAIHPFPLGQLEIENIWYSTTAADPTIVLPGFSKVRGAGFERWHFPEMSMTKLKVRLIQRNFVEEDGLKVFYIGAQEIAQQLVAFDQTPAQTEPINNNGVVVALEAPEGYNFDYLKRLYTTPNFSTILAEAGIRVYIFTDEALTNQVWSSYDDPPLETTPVYIGDLVLNKVYVLITLQFLQATGTSPILNDLVVGYSVTP